MLNPLCFVVEILKYTCIVNSSIGELSTLLPALVRAAMLINIFSQSSQAPGQFSEHSEPGRQTLLEF